MSQTFNRTDHDALSTLFDPEAKYAGYRPAVREAPNGDTKACPMTMCRGGVTGDGWECTTCHGTGRVPNVDAGPAAKRFLHVALKYNPPAWAEAYLARAHWEASKVAQALGVSKEYFPMPADGTLRVLEYPDAGHVFPALTSLQAVKCIHCDARSADPNPVRFGVCPALAPGAGTAEHTDLNLFTIVLWRSHPADLELTQPNECPSAGRCLARSINPGLHIGEIGELVGLGPATPHRVPARPYVQKSIVYFAMPDHGAPLECDCPRPDLHGHRPYSYAPAGTPCTGTTAGEWLKERIARSRY